jgi:hypothetical protein
MAWYRDSFTFIFNIEKTLDILKITPKEKDVDTWERFHIIIIIIIIIGKLSLFEPVFSRR